jgi:hypothetical protein
VLHDIATVVGPHIHLTHSDGTSENIEFSALISKTESLEAVSAEEASEEALTNANQ